jgi:hypothetical protein
VSCREPTVTPINSAISSRLFRQMHQLDTPGGEKEIGSDEESIGPHPHKGVEGCNNLAALAVRTWICNPMARAAGSIKHQHFACRRAGGNYRYESGPSM